MKIADLLNGKEPVRLHVSGHLKQAGLTAELATIIDANELGLLVQEIDPHPAKPTVPLFIPWRHLMGVTPAPVEDAADDDFVYTAAGARIHKDPNRR